MTIEQEQARKAMQEMLARQTVETLQLLKELATIEIEARQTLVKDKIEKLYTDTEHGLN